MRIALFDLDHTLLPHDTQTLFCNFVLKRKPWRVVLHLLFLPFGLAKALKLVPTATAKRAFHAYLWGMKRPELDRLSREFARTCVDAWIYPELRAELLRHRHQDRTLILNTASPSFYARYIAEVLEFDHWIATEVQPGQSMPLLPPIAGSNNKRQAKIEAMHRKIPALEKRGETESKDSWGYSDSPADIPLLEYCTHRILVHPSSSLIRHFDFDPTLTVLKPRRPYRTKVGDMLSVCLQLLGLYRNAPSR